MRRKLFVLTVAALMAVMMLTAGPAQANISLGGGSSIHNSTNVVQDGGSLLGFGTGLDFDGIGCCHRGLDIDDDDIAGNSVFFGLGDIDSDIEQNSLSGDLDTGFSVF